MRVPIVLAALVLAALAGCADAPGPEPEPVAEVLATQTIAGIVQDGAFEPIAGAEVTVVELNLSQRTDVAGRFQFPDLDVRPYTVKAVAEGYVDISLPVGPASEDELLFMLQAAEDPVQVIQEKYEGRFQCASETLIISGSCDRALVEYGGTSLFDQETIFEIQLGHGWQTAIVDVVFDAGQSQTYDGLRATVRGGGSADALTDYEQWGKFHGSSSYTIRIDPEGEYPEGSGPVPSDADTMVLDMFAQGHGWHALCTPPAVYDECFLGVGAGIDITFELLVSKWYGAPAPDGYTLQ